MNWIARQQPSLGETDGGVVFVILSFRNVRFFAPAGGDTYVPMYGSRDTLIYDSGNDLFTYITRSGAQWIFYGLDTPANPRGRLKSFFTSSGNEITLTYTGKQLTEASRSYESAPAETTTLKYVYEYVPSGDNAGLLETITLQRQVDADPAVNVKRVGYTYYDSLATYGNVGDLRGSQVERWNGSGWDPESYNYYRYYQGDAGGIGFQHGLRFALGSEAHLRLLQQENTLDPDTISNTIVADFADHYFEYDPSTRRVTKESVDGGSRSFTFTYTERTSPPDENYNYWQMKTVETRPAGGGVVTVYTNYIGAVLLRQLADGADVWCDYYQYNADGRLVLHAEPSAVVSYNDASANLGVTLQSSSGLIHVYGYYASDTPPAANGYLHYEAVKEGTGGTEIKLYELEYDNVTAGDVTVRPLSKRTVYRTDDNMNGIVTTFSYAGYYSGTVQPTQRTTTLPAVPTGENGANASDTRVEDYDEFGNVTSITDERGIVTTQSYDPATHALVQKIEDDGGLGLTTDYTVDSEGRTTQVLGPAHDVSGASVRTSTWIVYNDFVVRNSGIAQGIFHEVWSTQGYVSSSTDFVTSPPAPVSVTRIDGSGRTVAQIVSERDPGRSTAKLSSSENYTDQSRWARCTVNLYDDQSQLAATQVYFLIPDTGAGTEGTNYDQTDYLHDAMDRQSGIRSPAGTITRTKYDVRGLPTERWIGTNDNAFASPDFENSGTDNMVKVTSLEYDNGADQGGGNLTEQTQHVESTPGGNDRVTEFTYDFRNRQTAIDGPLNFYQKLAYDNLDRVTMTQQYDDDEMGNLLAQSETAYDTRGRVYRTTRYAVDPSDGSVGNGLVDNTWYDAAGNAVKSLSAGSELFTKLIYDGVGRVTAQYQGYYNGMGTEPYANVGQVTSSNIIFEQTISTYDEASNLIFAEHYQRFHDATDPGILNQPGGSDPKARVSYQAMWYDEIGRSIGTADYGTNGNAGPPTPGDDPPASTDAVHVSLIGYNERGEADQATDPEEVVTLTAFDDAGRVIATLQDDGGLDVLTEMTYHASGQLATLRAVNADTSDQITTYTYGIVQPASEITSNDLLAEVEYPESSGPTDVVTYTYNAQQQRIGMTDQNGTVHEYTYDQLGRQTIDKVTTLGTNGGASVDGAVRRIEQTYDVRGLLEHVTSYSATSGGSVVNDVLRTYNDFTQLLIEYQQHSAAVNTSTSPRVEYAYADGSANTIRQTQIVYPFGTYLEYLYGSSGSDADRLSRVRTINVASTDDICEYTYIGLNTFVRADYVLSSIHWDLITGGGANPYAGLDAFGRVIDCLWRKYSGSPTDLVRLKYGYNRDSSRLWREDTVASSGFDELYAYDNLQRLSLMARGDLNMAHNGITSPTLEQEWTLDPTGNWNEFVDGSVSLLQARDSNALNQITDITETSGPAWPTPAYNRAGNMTSMPRPIALTQSYTATYDAWNRLVLLHDGSGNVGAYAYDGLNRRVTKTVSSTVRHYYYSDRWQVVEERLGSSVVPNREYYWGLRYVDDLVMRLRDPSGGGLTHVHYVMQDANWNVVAIYNGITSTLDERYAYTAYGVVQFLNASFANIGSSSYDMNYLFTGRERDAECGLQINRNRYLHPPLGCWVTQDPIGYDAREVNLYRYAMGRPESTLDPAGTLAVKTIDASRTKGVSCGGSPDIYWDFVLSKPAPCDGYMVQQVDVRCLVDSTCNNCPPSSPSKPTFSYWEAWPMTKGESKPSFANIKSTDHSQILTFANSCGSKSHVGTIKFFCESPLDPASQGVGTGNLGGFGSEWPPSGWKVNQKHGTGNCEVSSSILPATDIAPPWWNKTPVEGPANRFLSVIWCCCPTKVQASVTVTANPS